MEGMIENNHRRAGRRHPGVLDRVLNRFGTGVEQRGALLVVPGSDSVECLGDLQVLLVGRRQKACVGEPLSLRGHTGNHRRCAVAHRGDGNAAAQIQKAVAVDIDQYAAARRGGIHTGTADQAGWQRRCAALGELARAWPRHFRRHSSHLGHCRPSLEAIHRGHQLSFRSKSPRA
ncbi:Uncharacterised protein [Mycobacteroides abscessus]|nr:Uncharacterised protein [Mycobacteroides abscessus]